MNGLEASARYQCSHAAPQSCPWCADPASDARDRRAGGWRFEEPRRLTDAQWQQWLSALHGQAAAEPLRRSS